MAATKDQSMETKDLLARYIDCAEDMISQCRELGSITGANKLERKCAAELKYLHSLARRKGGYNITHLRSSNLGHYAGVIHAAKALPGVTHILQPFSCPGRSDPLHIDVVAGQGHVWLKVVARKSKALHLIWAGECQFGDKDILQQAEDFKVCSQAHPVNFEDPKIVFSFYNGITVPLAKRLEGLGILIFGDIVPVDTDLRDKISQIGFEDVESEKDTSGLLGTIAYSDNKGHDCCAIEYAMAEESPDDTTSSSHVSLRDDLSFLKTSPKPNLEQLSVDSHLSDSLKKHLTTDITCEKHLIYDSVSWNEAESDRKTLKCIDSEVLEHFGHNPISTERFPNMETPQGFNQSVQDRDNTSKTGLIFQKQILRERDLQNNQDLDSESHFKNETMFRSPSFSFIAENLLINPSLDYSSLADHVSANEINVIEKIGKVNLDITALITLVSSVSHGGCNFRFKEKILSEQAAEERQDRVFPKLQNFLKGKQLYVCETAVHNFSTILETLGGKEEKRRAKALLSTVSVVPDNPSFRTMSLPNTGKIKDRSKIIFGTGDSLRAVTVSANSGFVRAAEHQGVTFTVFLHASRALTEQKETTAEVIGEED